MILCPNCHHEEIPGSLFCSECGAQLVVSEMSTTQHIQRNPSDFLNVHPPAQNQGAQSTAQAPVKDAVVSLHMVDTGQIVNLTGQTEFTLGRTSEGQPILPDVDLSAYEAYSKGVSRLHAALKIHNQRVVITDLGSSNGTRVNGQKIVPHVDYPLSHGDMIALGKFAIQILIRK
jgi:pSer/pThr/pTyr-binding forkhead associated (FHA) protein